MDQHLSHSFRSYLVDAFQEEKPLKKTNGIRVNPVVSEFATWYERIRNAMEYREDEVILRATIERIIKRRLILGENPQSVSLSLVRELIWARYFSDGSISEYTIKEISRIINLYVQLGKAIIKKEGIPESKVNEWMYHLMSSEIEHMLNPQRGKEAMSNFMFHVLKKNIEIENTPSETRDAQVFIAVRRSYARDDIALLRYQLFCEFFGKLNEKTFDTIASSFTAGYKTINEQLSHPLRHKIYWEIKKHTPPFFILEEILLSHKGSIHHLLSDRNEFAFIVFQTCEKKYRSIQSKIRRAIIRSVLFLLFTKAVFALIVETTYENIFYGSVLWNSMLINIIAPPFLMIFVGLTIRTPSDKNSALIVKYIRTLLLDENPQLGEVVKFKIIQEKKVLLNGIFSILWLATFMLSFGVVIFILSYLKFNLVSQTVFIFFLAIVAFLAYRINRIAHIYTVEETQSFVAGIADFFFLPIIQAGRYLTEGISQINVILFIFDFFIETPFKGFFAFAEQWFIFLRTKREELD